LQGGSQCRRLETGGIERGIGIERGTAAPARQLDAFGEALEGLEAGSLRAQPQPAEGVLVRHQGGRRRQR